MAKAGKIQSNGVHVHVEWRRRRATGGVDPRRVTFPGGADLSGDTDDPEEAFVTPEELFLAGVSSAQMHTYIDLCRRSGIDVLSYTDEASASVGRDEQGRPFIDRVKLKPRITFETQENPTFRAVAVRLVHESQDVCAIAGSVRSRIEVEPLLIWS